jgi:50S ribosomal protein L16 3-hydroxylase
MVQGLLGTLSSASFLRRHWQKRPLFVRGAAPACGAWLERGVLFQWAARDDVEARLVTRNRGRWSVQHGPFRPAQLRQLPARGWTLLVQGVEQIHAAGAALLQRFSFIPHARLDDLMVSYAAPGGGVGPHFDSYDVFLLQGAGRRRWRISGQRDYALVENAPLRILKRFRHTQEWIADCGDLLYLPPRYAHDGVAVGACITLSVGFRAPRRQALAEKFLEFLQEELRMDGIYEDPGLPLQRHPAQLPAALLQVFSHTLKKIRWGERDVVRFAGRFLTEPSAQTVFRPPRRAAALPAFVRQVASKGVRLALPTRMLFSGSHFFINGEHCRIRGGRDAQLIRLADERTTPAFAPSASTARLLHAWYCAGYIEI